MTVHLSIGRRCDREHGDTMKFEQIVCVDETRLTTEGYRDLQQFSNKLVIVYSDYPASNEEILTRIQGADCVLVSPLTPISAEVLQAANRLKYVGMCCSLYDASSANVEIEAAQSQHRSTSISEDRFKQAISFSGAGSV